MNDLFETLGEALGEALNPVRGRKLRDEKTILLDRTKRDIDKIYKLETQIKALENCGNCKHTGYHRPRPDLCDLCKNYKHGNIIDSWEFDSRLIK